MAWEWEYNSKGRQWTLDVGGWHAIVERVEGPRYLWKGHIERVSNPNERYDGPTDKEAVYVRSWCLTKIAELRGTTHL
jgi:hypothetical protein